MDVWRTQGFTAFAPPWRGMRDVEEPAQPPPPPGVEHGAPPSTYAIVDVLDGKRGAIPKLIGLTLLRSVFIFPGFWVASKFAKADLDLKQLAILSASGSVTISVGMLAYYYVRRKTA